MRNLLKIGKISKRSWAPVGPIFAMVKCMLQRRISNWLFLFLLIPFLFACGKDDPAADSASALGSGDLRWSSFPVEIYADQAILTDSNAEADFLDAMDFWERKAGKNLFIYRGEWQSEAPTFFGPVEDPTDILANIVMLQNPWPFEANVAGKTIIKRDSNTIQGALVLINAETSLCDADCVGQFTQTSRRKLFAHELGHFIGFGHSMNQSDIMFPEILSGGSLDEVTIDDPLLLKLTQ